VNDCQIDSCDHCSDRLNPQSVSLEVSSHVADVVAALAVTETENAETAVGTGQDYLHLNRH
jgi:hypothetical protein